MEFRLTDVGLEPYFNNQDIRHLTEINAMSKPIENSFDLNNTNGLDLGCGKKKSLETAIGVDCVRGPTKPFGWLSFPDLIARAEDLPFKDETIDWITASHLIEHYENPVEVINEWLRVIKKQGVISMLIPIAEHTGKIGEPGTDATHKHDYSVEKFKTDVLDKIENINIIQCKDVGIKWSMVATIQKI